MSQQQQKRSGSLRDETCPTHLGMVFNQPGSSALMVPETELTLGEALDSLKAGAYTSFAVSHAAHEAFAERRLRVSGDQNRITGVEQDSLFSPVACTSDQCFQIEETWTDNTDESGRAWTRCSAGNEVTLRRMMSNLMRNDHSATKSSVVVVSMMPNEPRWTADEVQSALESDDLVKPANISGQCSDRNTEKLVSFQSTMDPSQGVTTTSVQRVLDDSLSFDSVTIVRRDMPNKLRKHVFRQLCTSRTVDRPEDEDETQPWPWHVETVFQTTLANGAARHRLSAVWKSDLGLTTALKNVVNSDYTDQQVAMRVSHLPRTPSHTSRLQRLG
ncbi:hypothetical protein EHS25_008241 [Saitozyma podzolica]|uniref:Uncharacterized protein n=1 Tax=Saitozyma podzolica TaxID=1890683 RepID=A0A427YNY6_9TREE|nr:hypothetical protein EHS25_008241 [Saitozyma podzolica]